MDYSKLSDFEINEAVAKAVSLIINDTQSASLKLKSSSVLVNDITSSWEFNPCNNPSDAWPIIVENEISLLAPAGALNYWDAVVVDICVEHANPLRAAMIVYLMMQEGNLSTLQSQRQGD